jgi:hypothetical protein
LYFADDDLLAVHTLSRAAFRVLFDISPKQSNDGFEKNLSEQSAARRGRQQSIRAATMKLRKEGELETDYEIGEHSK